MNGSKIIEINFCPACGSESFEPTCVKSWKCRQCGFIYFHNIAAAAAGLVEIGDKMLFIVRAHEPMKGKLDLSGGFCDHNESAQQTVSREIKEELGLDIPAGDFEYFNSYPNEYIYSGVTYSTLDMTFIARLDSLPQLNLSDEVLDIKLLGRDEIDIDTLAFRSTRNAVMDFISR